MKKPLLNLKLMLMLCLIAGSINTNAEVLEWARSTGGKSTDNSRSIAVDKNGNTYIAGTFYGTTDFNPGPGVDTLSPRGTQEAFLAKYDPNGNYLWAIRIGGDRADEGNAVALDEDGNVYVTGFFVFRAFFDPSGKDTLKAGAGFQDAFVAKYDSNGNYKWAVNMGGTKVNTGTAITVSKQGNVYVTGGFSGTTDFEPGTTAGRLDALPGNFFGQGATDIFMAKYDANGKFIWAKSMGAAQGDDYGYGIAVDETENVFLTGYFSNTADFDPGTNNEFLMALGIHDIFVAKYDAGGNYLWARSMGSKNDDNGLDIALDKASNAYITGYFSDTAIFNAWGGGEKDTIVSAGRKRPDLSFSDYDMFVAKYDSAGQYIWSRTLGSKYEDIGYAIATDRVGNIFVTGTFADTAVFEPWGTAKDTLIALGGLAYAASRPDVFLAKYDPDGNHLWSGSVGGSYGYIYSSAIACDGNGNTYATGRYMDTANLDPDRAISNQFIAVGSSDIFILKLACNDTSSSEFSATTCEDAYTWNDETYTATGAYTQAWPNHAGCDSIVTLNLTLSKVEKPNITVQEFVLGVTGSYTSYQWLKNGEIIPDATESTYTVTENADYQVIVTNEDGCTDTSNVYKIDNYTGIDDVDGIAGAIRIFPNPATDMVHISSSVPVVVTLTNIEGKVLQKVSGAHTLSLSGLANGMYLLVITDSNQRLIKTEKIVKHKE